MESTMKRTKVSSIDVSHIAKLAKIPLKKKEEEKFAEQLSRVMEYVGQIGTLDTKSVKSRGQVTLEENRFRDDVVTADRMLTQKEALGQAKHTHRGFFVVPAVFDKHEV